MRIAPKALHSYTAAQLQDFPINTMKRCKGLTVVLEVAAGVDGLELRDGGARGSDVGRLQRRALDEPRGAAGVRAKEVGVGHHPERGVVLHHAALCVPARPASGGGGGERLGEIEGRQELSRLLARETHADLGAGALQLAPRAPHASQPAAASELGFGEGLGFWYFGGRDGGEGVRNGGRRESKSGPGRYISLKHFSFWAKFIGWWAE